jgi:branched-chain amino acid transport system permease protein
MEPLQNALFGRVLLDAETVRLLVFGIALVAIMLYRPAGLWPSAVRKRELETPKVAAE